MRQDVDVDSVPRLFSARCERPLLVASFARPQAMLSWALARPGFQRARRVAWLEVREEEVPPEVDACELLALRLAEARLGDAVGMMTSRDVRLRTEASSSRAGCEAQCLATVGLANAERVGAGPASRSGGWGTINLLAAVSVPLSQAALIEALSIAVEARTAAIMDAGWRLETGVATGTGTDCVVVSAPEGDGGAAFAGLHTAVGAAVGAAVREAVCAGAEAWIAGRSPK